MLLDSDPAVVFFNRINIALLRAAKSREDYRRLRIVEDLKTWQNRANDLSSEDPARKLLLSPEAHQWWKDNIRESSYKSNFGFLHGTADRSGGLFAGANYLIHESQFKHIQRLARADDIEAHVVDVADGEAIGFVTSALEKAGEKIAVLDLSNLWTQTHLGLHGVAQVIASFKRSYRADSLILLTAKNDKGAKREGWDTSSWSYDGFTFEASSRARSYGAPAKGLQKCC